MRLSHMVSLIKLPFGFRLKPTQEVYPHKWMAVFVVFAAKRNTPPKGHLLRKIEVGPSTSSESHVARKPKRTCCKLSKGWPKTSKQGCGGGRWLKFGGTAPWDDLKQTNNSMKPTI